MEIVNSECLLPDGSQISEETASVLKWLTEGMEFSVLPEKGKWFVILPNSIRQNFDNVKSQMKNLGKEAEALLSLFEETNRKTFPCIIFTKIMPKKLSGETERELRELCKKEGIFCEQMTESVAVLELQMQLLNGRNVRWLFEPELNSSRRIISGDTDDITCIYGGVKHASIFKFGFDDDEDWHNGFTAVQMLIPWLKPVR